MKYQKLVNELNDLLDSASKERHRHQEKLKAYLEHFKAEEKELQRKMRKANDEAGREKLKKKMSTVRQAYTILGY